MIKAYFDGCCEPANPGGTASYGAIILKNNKKIWECSKLFIPNKKRETSNNLAEYQGFIAILNYLLKNKWNKEEIMIYGDSKLVISQMFGNWGIKKGLYVESAKQAKAILSAFPKTNGEWIPRRKNSIADKLSKKKLIEAGIKINY